MRVIGKYTGRFIQSDLQENNLTLHRRFVRVKAYVEVGKPLRLGFFMDKKKRRATFAILQI